MVGRRGAFGVAGALVLGGLGCFNAGLPARTGELLEAGHVGVGVSLPVASYAPGRFETSSGGYAEGNSAQRSVMMPLGYLLFHAFDSVGHLHYAPLAWLELGLSAGAQQQGLDVRFALLDERAGAPLSLAVGLAGAFRPFDALDRGFYALGFDASRWFGDVAPLLDVWVSYGPEAHAVSLEETPLVRECGGFGEEGCGEYGPPRHARAVRDELRLAMAFGVAFRASEVHRVTLALQPYVTLATPGRTDLSCEGCSYVALSGLKETWGFHVTVGYLFAP